MDFIVANDISASDAGFAVETNRVTILFANGTRESLPRTSKVEVAEKIIELLENEPLLSSMGQKGRERVELIFCKERYAKQIEDIYKLIIRYKT